MPPNNPVIANLQAQMAYDQQRINIRASCLQLALQGRSLQDFDGKGARPTAEQLVEDAKKMELYVFDGIKAPTDGPKLVHATHVG